MEYLIFNPSASTLGDFNVETIGAEFGKTDPDASRGERVKGNLIVVLKLKRSWCSLHSKPDTLSRKTQIGYQRYT